MERKIVMATLIRTNGIEEEVIFVKGDAKLGQWQVPPGRSAASMNAWSRRSTRQPDPNPGKQSASVLPTFLWSRLARMNNITQSALAERFGMSTSNMKRILARRSWKHI
jgi:hypothetical protein